MLSFPITPFTYDQLDGMSRPYSADQPEAITWRFYDTQNLASNWTAASFFAQPNADTTLSNIQNAAGQLPSDQYFLINAIQADFLIPAASAAATPDAANDITQILFGARAVVEVSVGSKLYLQAPLSCFHSTGGVATVMQGTPAAAAIATVAQNWWPDGDFHVDNGILLPPRQGYSVTVRGVAAALVATRALRLTLAGTLYRRVL